MVGQIVVENCSVVRVGRTVGRKMLGEECKQTCFKKNHVCYTLLLFGSLCSIGILDSPANLERLGSLIFSEKKKVLRLLLHGTLPETNTSHLRMVVSKIRISFSRKSIFRCELLVSGRINHGVCCRWTQLSYGRHCDSVIL